MEEVILGLGLSGEELNVVYQENIDHLVEIHKVVYIVVSDGVNKLVDEALRGNIQYGLLGRSSLLGIVVYNSLTVAFSTVFILPGLRSGKSSRRSASASTAAKRV